MEHGNVKAEVGPLDLSLLGFLLSLGLSPWAALTDVVRFPNLKPSPRYLETELFVLRAFSTSVANEHKLRFSRWTAYSVNIPWIQIFTNSFSSHTSWMSRERSRKRSIYSIKSSFDFCRIRPISVKEPAPELRKISLRTFCTCLTMSLLIQVGG